MQCIIKQREDGRFDVRIGSEGGGYAFSVTRRDMEKLGATLVADAGYRRLGADLIDYARHTPLSSYEYEHGEVA